METEIWFQEIIPDESNGNWSLIQFQKKRKKKYPALKFPPNFKTKRSDSLFQIFTFDLALCSMLMVWWDIRRHRGRIEERHRQIRNRRISSGWFLFRTVVRTSGSRGTRRSPPTNRSPWWCARKKKKKKMGMDIISKNSKGKYLEILYKFLVGIPSIFLWPRIPG